MKHMHILLITLAILAFSGFAHAQGVSISSYNVDPSPVSPGQSFTLYAYVNNNTPTPVSNVVFTLDLSATSEDTSFPFSLEPTDTLTRNLGTIPAFTTVQVQYTVLVSPEALDGAYTLRLFAMPEGSSAGATLDAVVNIVSRAPVISITQSSPTTAQIGETLSLQLTIKNTGSSRAHDIQVGLAEDRTVTTGGTVIERDIVPLGASVVFVPSLDAGQTTTVTLPVQVNPSASSRAYFIPIDVTFFDSADAANTITTTIGLKVAGDPQLDTYVSESDPLAQPGHMARVTIDLFNTGLGPAKFVTVTFPSSDVVSMSQSQYFIGTIESDDFDSVVADATFANVSPGMHSFPIQIAYKNEFGESKTLSKNVDIRVYSSSEVSSTTGGDSPVPLVLAILVIGGLIWWFRFRKPKNGNGAKK